MKIAQEIDILTYKLRGSLHPMKSIPLLLMSWRSKELVHLQLLYWHSYHGIFQLQHQRTRTINTSNMDLLQDTSNCTLRMRRECRERFPHHRLQKKPLVSDHDMHHGTCATHVPWCMLGLLTRGGGENVPGIPGACATPNFTIWQEAHGMVLELHSKHCITYN